MFTGIIAGLAGVESIETAPGGSRLALRVDSGLAGLETGESIAIDGVCLTAEPESTPERLLFFLSDETLEKTTLGALSPDARVNIERSLRAGDLMGGHLVMGHVDGVGTIRRLDQTGEAWHLEVQCPVSFLPFLASKGSVAVDGISLTIVDVLEEGFTVAVIPHTHAVTSLQTKKPGSRVNLEADALARYVVARLAERKPRETLDRDLLERAGFV